MNPLQLGAAVALLVAGAVWCVARSLRRAPASLAVARQRMYGGAAGSGTAAAASWRDTIAAGPTGGWVERHFGEGLQMVGLTITDVATRVVVSISMLLFAVLAAVAALMSLGMLPLSSLWLLLSPVAAAMGGLIVVHDLDARIDRQRRLYRRTANDFVQLVAVGLTTDQSVEEAVRFALQVGAGEAFDALRSELQAAPQRGVPLWETIDDFGRRYDVRELCEFATSLERQGLQGVSISDTVASLAGSMRAKALDELERDADRANASLSGPTIGFVVSTIVFLAYPLAQRISDAFGG
ncbi:MAG: hypothetical protein F2681_10580 [Actinobacteria bacterium]|uniref:Unannotated protein n=1 Tax=freshwater metagenome TaxID=449393 RepID=A0A6J7JM17_9ZZZZ|nr:hypothetical protein [Actinomycetota bacterium]MSW78328.1 hypothetical protein [Actinomycetota bacterium]MSX56350.1 hypothetical protein [Actinomycetota bacterium]MSX93953.1 hypothetical protein [Actinomycetota bacterium]MSZ83574.1 hypothetical protein [Actinomycetota bacterium]